VSAANSCCAWNRPTPSRGNCWSGYLTNPGLTPRFSRSGARPAPVFQSGRMPAWMALSITIQPVTGWSRFKSAAASSGRSRPAQGTRSGYGAATAEFRELAENQGWQRGPNRRFVYRLGAARKILSCFPPPRGRTRRHRWPAPGKAPARHKDKIAGLAGASTVYFWRNPDPIRLSGLCGGRSGPPDPARPTPARWVRERPCR